MTSSESPIPRVKGTSDWLPGATARRHALQALILERVERAGYARLQTPILERVELHERKSGAGIVTKLFEIAGDLGGRACLRPELTAGIVRAYTEAEPCPPLPWRVSHAGPAFRREPPGRLDRLREFRQVGVERMGDSGPFADAEVIWLAHWAAAEAGIRDASIRVGHVGLILELLERSGLPAPARAALVEMLSEAAAEGRDVNAIGRGLDHFSAWAGQLAGTEEVPIAVHRADDAGIDRLFRTLVPVINGRRSGHEIIHRLRRKWDLGQGLLDALDRVRGQVRALGGLKGPPGVVLERLRVEYEALAPDSVAALRDLVACLGDHGVPAERLELDLGFGRGIGFYSQVIFEVIAPTPGGPVEVGGGGRYDGLARVLGSPRDDRGVGFAFGLERMAAALDAQGVTPPGKSRRTLLVVPESDEMRRASIRLANQLRSQGVRAILEAGWDRAGFVERAGRLGADATVVVVGGDPAGYVLHDHARQASGRINLRDLVDQFAADPGEARS